MLISTKGRYALRVMIDLAEHQADGFVPLKLIAQRQEISEKYLESIIKLLVKNEICFRRQTKTEGACECRISGTHVHPLFYHLFCAVFCASEVPLELLI